MMNNKLHSYDLATQKLMAQATELDVPTTGAFSLPKMVHLLRESFKYQLTYYRVFNELRPRNYDPSLGFCRVASYYINTHFPGQFHFMRTPIHWWLRHRETGIDFDITYTQFNDPFPYHLGQIEEFTEKDQGIVKILQNKAMILGKSAGLE